MTEQTKPQVSGYLILETLITIGILAVGLLGVSAMQINALKSSIIAVQRGEAAILIANMSDRMRANPQGIINNQYAGLTAANITIDDSSIVGSIAERAQADFNQWVKDIDQVFTSSSSPLGTINCNDTDPGNCTLSISWNETRADTSVAGSTAETYTHQTSIAF